MAKVISQHNSFTTAEITGSAGSWVLPSSVLIYVDAGAAINEDSSHADNVIRIDGRAISSVSDGVHSEGASSDISVTAQGAVVGATTGIYTSGANETITNAGTIDSKGNGIQSDGESLSIDNSGAIGALAMSGGTSAVGKVGISAIKAAKRMGRLSKALERQLVRLTADAVDTRVLRTMGRDLGSWNFTAALDEAKRLVKPRVVNELSDTGGALRGVFDKQGYRGTLQVLETAETTGDIRQLERMSERLGGKFRGALFLKRGARLTFKFTEFLVSIVLWLASALLWLLWAGYFSLRMLWKTGKMSYRLVAFALKKRDAPFPLQSTANRSI